MKGGAVSDVRIIIGTDKLHWPHLDDGESRRFQTAAALPAELTVLYSFDNHEHFSRGPDIMASGRVQITIEPSAHQPDRAVTYQVLPSGQ